MIYKSLFSFVFSFQLFLETGFVIIKKWTAALPIVFKLAPFIPEGNIWSSLNLYSLIGDGCFEKVIAMYEYEVSKYSCAAWRNHQKHLRAIPLPFPCPCNPVFPSISSPLFQHECFTDRGVNVIKWDPYILSHACALYEVAQSFTHQLRSDNSPGPRFYLSIGL